MENRLAEAILMSTYNISFYGEISKMITKYPPYLFHWEIYNSGQKVLFVLYSIHVPKDYEVRIINNIKSDNNF